MPYINVQPKDFVYLTRSWVDPQRLIQFLSDMQTQAFQAQQSRTQLLNELSTMVVYGPTKSDRFPIDTYLINITKGGLSAYWFGLTQSADTKDRVFEVSEARAVTNAESKLATQRVDDATVAIRNAIKSALSYLIAGEDIYSRTSFEAALGWIWQENLPPPPQTAASGSQR
uniref:Capsid protein n=1 Tax=Rattail cactus necrosis-associated virus TaxID=1123754 RepID=A0A7G7P081_9VIRU|nr:coat protein [Rattail cactus necrosis-associated virus]